MTAAEPKGSSRALMLVSLALIAANFPFAKLDDVQISGLPISVPFQFLWLAWAYLFMPLAREVKSNNLHISCLIRKDLKSGLASWSRKIKEKEAPSLYAPQVLVSIKRLGLRWEFKYCQADSDLESSFTAISGWFTSGRFILAACLNNLFSLRVLELFSVPLLLAALALLTKIYFLHLNR